MKKFYMVVIVLFISSFTSVSAFEVSLDAGYYEGPISVSLTLQEEEVLLRYTLDGTDPKLDGIEYTGSITVTQRPSTPSSLALNNDISLWPFPKPSSTLKATVLRVVSYDANAQVVQEEAYTYFLGYDDSMFTVPVWSIVVTPENLESYEKGLYVKGQTFYEHGGEEGNPFSPANWNNDDLRAVSFYEVFNTAGERVHSDSALFYPSGNHASSADKKALKLNHDGDIGGKNIKDDEVLAFGEKALGKYDKIRFRQGSQDRSNGVQMRDCIAALLADEVNVERMYCDQAVVFLNGEYWGEYNIREEVDNKYLEEKYGLDSDDDVVMIEKNGIVEEGEPQDAQLYYTLRDWMNSHDLSDDTNYQFFESQVNVQSLIDYYVLVAFFVNEDWPNDHRIWKNKGTPIPDTPADGRWYFILKDVDQGMGLFDNRPVTENTLQRLLDDTSPHTLFFRKCMENPTCYDAFVARALELMDTTLNPANTLAVTNEIYAQKLPMQSLENARWQKPIYPSKVDALKMWLMQRTPIMRTTLQNMEVTTESGNTTVPSPTNETNTSGQVFDEEYYLSLVGELQDQITVLEGQVLLCSDTQTNTTVQPGGTSDMCWQSVAHMPVGCYDTMGTIVSVTSDTLQGSCRTIVCGEKVTKMCEKGTEMILYHQTWNNVGANTITACFGTLDGVPGQDACIKDWGSRASPEHFDNALLCS